MTSASKSIIKPDVLIRDFTKQNSIFIKKVLIRYTVDHTNPQLLKLYKLIAESDKISTNKISFEKLKAHYLKVIFNVIWKTS